MDHFRSVAGRLVGHGVGSSRWRIVECNRPAGHQSTVSAGLSDSKSDQLPGYCASATSAV
ncbi:hypothetical protein IMCC9480_728 [Oxalobacteraceae bacterium IMCC9480]|nr:hypothetical protein IMCC9480_728 [Oxalobacteraceae bacterium IMCC9480]